MTYPWRAATTIELLRYGCPGEELPVFALKGLLFSYLAHNTGHPLCPKAVALKEPSPEVSNVSSNLILLGGVQCFGDSALSFGFSYFDGFHKMKWSGYPLQSIASTAKPP